MNRRPIKNMAASVHERLLRQAKNDQRPFNELLQYFAMDRFLYRWSKSKYHNKFVLKGALMLKVWEAATFRTTRDIDMLAYNIGNDLSEMTDVVKEVISLKIAPDGLVFEPFSVTAERITEDADYEGVRIKFQGNLGNAKKNADRRRFRRCGFSCSQTKKGAPHARFSMCAAPLL